MSNIVTVEKVARRVYLVNLPFARKDAAKEQLGAKWDADRKQWYVSSTKAADAEEFARKANSGELAPDKPDANKLQIAAKVEYKGRTYYCSSFAIQGRLHLHSLPDSKGDFISFWADNSACVVVKNYQKRTVGFGRHAREEYQSLGGIARFIAQQKTSKAAGVPQCAACHRHSEHLIEDNEDGLMKCRGCCDMPSE